MKSAGGLYTACTIRPVIVGRSVILTQIGHADGGMSIHSSSFALMVRNGTNDGSCGTAARSRSNALFRTSLTVYRDNNSGHEPASPSDGYHSSIFCTSKKMELGARELRRNSTFRRSRPG